MKDSIIVCLIAFFFGAIICMSLVGIYTYKEKETANIDRAVTNELIRICVQDQKHNVFYCIRKFQG